MHSFLCVNIAIMLVIKRRPPKSEELKLSGTQNGQRVNHGIVKFKEFEQIYLSPKMPTTFVLGELIF